MALMQITIEKYYNPTLPGDAGFMAHSDTEDANGLYGFGRMAQEAINDFAKQLENEK